MRRRNWLELSRKLVDRFDFDYTMNAVRDAISRVSTAYFGEGVLLTTVYPVPFPIVLSSSAMTGTVGGGIAFDPSGQLTEIDPASPTSKTFTISAADSTHPRWDLLVLRYAGTGDTPVPKPSDPISTIFLNLHDDFALAVIAGTPGVSPAYPAKGVNDIILDGIQVPAGVIHANQCALDASIREIALGGSSQNASFVQENIGIGNGATVAFNISQTPLNIHSLIILKDGLKLEGSEWSLVGTVVTLAVAPAASESIDAYYVANDPNSQNPLSGFQEAIGTGDDVTDTFNLSGHPANQASTLVFVDGAVLPITKWSLIQGAVSQIKFLAGSLPASGQALDVFYLVNAGTVGSAPSSSSAYVPYGTPGAPLVIDPAAGIVVSTDSLQLRFVQGEPLGGAQPVTAIPQIAPGSAPGQELKIKGTNDVDFPVLQDGNGLSLNGLIQLKNKTSIVLTWDGSVWEEDARRA